jgi:hypothetical protein
MARATIFMVHQPWKERLDEWEKDRARDRVLSNPGPDDSPEGWVTKAFIPFATGV